MGKLFISYRRADSTKDARAVYERLRRELREHEVFIDLEGIEPGEDFVAAIERHLNGCDALIVLIGKNWLSAPDDNGTARIFGDGDFVRIEISSALGRGIRIFPVLLDGAQPPQSHQLPEDMRSIVRRQAISLDYTRFDQDILKLANSLTKALKQSTTEQSGQLATDKTSSLNQIVDNKRPKSEATFTLSEEVGKSIITGTKLSLSAEAEIPEQHSPKGINVPKSIFVVASMAGALIFVQLFIRTPHPTDSTAPNKVTAASASGASKDTTRPVTEAEAKAEYDRLLAASDKTEYRVRHILVETESEARALIARIKRGEDFGTLAKRYSKDPGSSNKGGDLDFSGPSSFVPEFSDAMIKLQAGSFTQSPVMTKFGYHVIRVDEIRAARYAAFEDVKDQMISRVEQIRQKIMAK